ncbi:MAG: dienelactone hydrolase family protein [Stappiaceae bacterium]
MIDSGTYHLLLPEQKEYAGAVVLLHGGGGTGQGLLQGGMAKAAVERGYVFVAPNGYHPTARFKNNWAVRAKNFGHEIDDIAFLSDVIDAVSEDHQIDRTKFLLAGFSRGGSMVWDVACHKPGLARAYAPSAGAFWDDLPEKCAGPVDLFHTHGWDDPTVPLEGRPLFNDKVAQGDVWDAPRILRETNGCGKRQPEHSTIEGDRLWRHWSDCRAGRIDLMLHPGGHGAPSGWAQTTLDWFENRLAEN